MLILGLDTSTERLSLALWRLGKTLEERDLIPERRHGEVILGEVDALLHAARVTPRDLQGVAVGLGPGSFTGLRVGVATAQGLAQSLGVPLAGVSSFAAAAAASGGEIALVVADARQDLLYVGLYARCGETVYSLMPESLISVAETAARVPDGQVLLTGPGAGTFLTPLQQAGAAGLTLAEESLRWPDAAVVARLAAPSLDAGGERPEAIVPHYLRRTQAEEVRARREHEGAA
jgi:tRNA threonylcarbamoyladenosine biosynthesis protein TsaB